MKNIGERIMNIRANEKLTQEKFSSIIGISQAHLSAIENGRCGASKPVIRLICLIFSKNEKDFF